VGMRTEVKVVVKIGSCGIVMNGVERRILWTVEIWNCVLEWYLLLGIVYCGDMEREVQGRTEARLFWLPVK